MISLIFSRFVSQRSLSLSLKLPSLSALSFEVQGFEDSQITVELEAETEYQVFIDGASTGTMTTNLGGKLSFSVELDADTKAEVKIVKC